MGWAALAAVGGQMIGGYMGDQKASKDRAAAEAARQQALAQYLNIAPPSIADQQLIMQQYQNAGNYNPALDNALQLGQTEMGGIATDPRLVQAQMSALEQLSQTGQMGMTPAEAAALASSNRQTQSQAQAKSEQILDNFARRGMGGSGAELSAQLLNAQEGADRASQQGMDISQNAQQNALQAISQAGQLGGQMQAQEFGQKSDIAKAKDYINQFNLANAQKIQSSNVGTSNQASLHNLMQQQNQMNMNTQLQNQQDQYNKQLLQQQFNNQMSLASGRAGQYQGVAQGAQQNAANVANMWAGIGQGVGTGLGAIYQNSQRQPMPAQQQQSQQYNYGGYGNAGGGGYEGFSPAEEDAWLDHGSDSDQGF